MTERNVLDMPEKGCVVWIEGGSLFGCERNSYHAAGGSAETAIETGVAFELTAPENQAFLDLINDGLGTSFSFDDFAGR